MIPSLDLILGTIERALTVAILPAAANASAKEEASLGILFTRWLRDVVDHAGDAERASYRDCREALADVIALLGKGGGAAASVVAESRAFLERPAPETAAAVRADGRTAKSLLSRALRAARADDSEAATAIRKRLGELAGRELEREIAFGRATGIDPDGAKGPPLAEVLKAQNERRSAR